MEVPFLKEELIIAKVRKFKQLYCGNQLPVEIEKVAEFKLGISIRPEPNMEKLCDSDALITSGFKVIFVDSHRYGDVRYDNRLRFSLAHEVGHFILHQKVYSSFQIKEIEDIYQLIERISDQSYRSLEWQASRFASHLLIPRNTLRNERDKLKSIAIRKYPKLKSINNKLLDGYLAKDLSNFFGVSEDATEYALQDLIND